MFILKGFKRVTFENKKVYIDHIKYNNNDF